MANALGVELADWRKYSDRHENEVNAREHQNKEEVVDLVLSHIFVLVGMEITHLLIPVYRV